MRGYVSGRGLLAGLMGLFLLAGCGGGGGGGGTPSGTLKITVTQAGVTPAAYVSGARVAVIDGSTGDVVQVLTTNDVGTASVALPVGQVKLAVAAQGFESSPESTRLEPLPFVIEESRTTAADISLGALPDATVLGSISGKVSDASGRAVANALVMSSSGTVWNTTATDAQGNYVLFNVPAGGVQLTALRAGHNFPNLTRTVTAGADTAASIVATGAAGGSVSGRVSFLASQNGVVDVTLVHPETGLVVPGLSTMSQSSGGNYSLKGVPNGTFDAIASLDTDGYVLDPDSIVKFGMPTVTMSGAPVLLDFDVTDSFALRRPTAHPVMPVNGVVFQWYAYPQTKDYVLELINESGDVIWGGYAPGANNYTVPSTTTKAGSDANGGYYGLAFPEAGLLEVGRTYRVRVYASVDDNTAPFYKLISMTEDLEGVFTVGEAQ